MIITEHEGKKLAGPSYWQ